MERIAVNPKVCSGKPVIAGTRIMVRNIVSLVSAGKTFADVHQAYPGIMDADIEAAVDFARAPDSR